MRCLGVARLPLSPKARRFRPELGLRKPNEVPDSASAEFADDLRHSRERAIGMVQQVGQDLQIKPTAAVEAPLGVMLRRILDPS